MVNENVSVLQKTIKIISDYGILKVIQAITTIALLLFIVFYVPIVTQNAARNGSIEAGQTLEKEKNELHTKKIKLRNKLQPELTAVLSGVLTDIGADRAFIIELHNGSASLNTVSFIHGTMTYEETKNGVENIDDEFQNISLSHYTFVNYLHTHHIFVGNIRNLSLIDKRFAAKLGAYEVKYIAIMALYGDNGEYGYIGAAYNEGSKIPSNDKISRELTIASQMVSRLFYQEE